MSEKKAKALRFEEKKATKEDYETQLEAAIKSQQETLAKSKEFLCDDLAMAAEKFKTVNGFMQALTTINAVFLEKMSPDEYLEAKTMAAKLAGEIAAAVADLQFKIGGMDVEEINDMVLEEVIDDEFIDNTSFPTYAIAKELLLCQVLQNAAGPIRDLMEFRASTNEQIEKIKEAIAELD